MKIATEQLAKSSTSQNLYRDLIRRRFAATVTQHLAALDADALRGLAVDSMLLVDEAMIMAGDASFDSVYIAVAGQEVTSADRERWNFPRFTQRPIFEGLREFVNLQHQVLNPARTGRNWMQMSSPERLNSAICFVGFILPVDLYMDRLCGKLLAPTEGTSQHWGNSKPSGPTH